jgi:hypothetical protein
VANQQQQQQQLTTASSPKLIEDSKSMSDHTAGSNGERDYVVEGFDALMLFMSI